MEEAAGPSLDGALNSVKCSSQSFRLMDNLQCLVGSSKLKMRTTTNVSMLDACQGTGIFSNVPSAAPLKLRSAQLLPHGAREAGQRVLAP